MIIRYLENVRTLRGAEASRKYRYTRKVELKCDLCENIRVVNATPKIKNSLKHPCKSCLLKELGKQNRGRTPYNKGSIKNLEDCLIGKPYLNSSGYWEVYVGSAFKKTSRQDKYRLLHRLVAEIKFGEPLPKHFLVHHVDGDKTNSSPDNLYLCESKAVHQDIHSQLESLSMNLVKKGIIQFDHSTGTYQMPHLEEILDAYRVNSGKPYVLEIKKSGDMAILSQAEVLETSEGATTIPLGSRDQEISKRTTT